MFLVKFGIAYNVVKFPHSLFSRDHVILKSLAQKITSATRCVPNSSSAASQPLLQPKASTSSSSAPPQLFLFKLLQSLALRRGRPPSQLLLNPVLDPPPSKQAQLPACCLRTREARWKLCATARRNWPSCPRVGPLNPPKNLF